MDTLECNISWDDDGDEDPDADETDEEIQQQGTILRSGSGCVDLFVVVGLVYKDKKGAWHVDGGLFGNSEDGSGDKDVPDSGPGRDAAKPALAARVGYDDVGPGHLETAERDACENGNEGAGERVAGDVGADEADDAAVKKVVDYGDVEAAETGKGASLGTEVLDGCAHFGGDGLLLDEEEV